MFLFIHYQYSDYTGLLYFLYFWGYKKMEVKQSYQICIILLSLLQLMRSFGSFLYFSAYIF